MTLLIITIVLAVLLIVSSLVIYNLLKKVERYEEDVIYKDEYIDKLREMASQAHTKIKELDIREAFESDDEVGFFFKNLKDMIVAIDAYSRNYSK